MLSVRTISQLALAALIGVGLAASSASAQDVTAESLNAFLQASDAAPASTRLCLGVSALNHLVGARVLQVEPGSAAAAADIRVGDWIILASYQSGGHGVVRVVGLAQGHWAIQRIVQDAQTPPATLTLLISRQGTLMVKRVTLKPCVGPHAEGDQGPAEQRVTEEAA